MLDTTIPRYTFGANLNGSYKGFDLSVQIQGAGKGNGYLYGPGIMPFSVGNLGGTILEPNKDRWTPQARFISIGVGQKVRRVVFSVTTRCSRTTIGCALPMISPTACALKSRKSIIGRSMCR